MQFDSSLLKLRSTLRSNLYRSVVVLRRINYYLQYRITLHLLICIWILTNYFFTGYLNDEDAHAMNGGWLRTGDVAYFDSDGYLYIVGRLKEVIKYKGFQVCRLPVAEQQAQLKLSTFAIVVVDIVGESFWLYFVVTNCCTIFLAIRQLQLKQFWSSTQKLQMWL